MDFNVNSISSNLMLIGLVLVSMCCLYLLYTNFTKLREIEELKRRVEDLKKIFLNQQIHNDETFSKINTVLFQSLTNGKVQHIPPTVSLNSRPDSRANTLQETHNNADVNNEIAMEVAEEITHSISTYEPTKTINLDLDVSDISNLVGGVSSMNAANIVINKEGYYSDDNSNSIMETNLGKSNNEEQKEINIDLHDLDNINDAINNIEDDGHDICVDGEDNMDKLDLDECEEFDVDKLSSPQNVICHDGKMQITKDNIFNLDTINITNDEIFDDLEETLSIATAPIDETNDIINHNSNFNLDEIQDIQDIDDLDDNLHALETVDIKTIRLNIHTTATENIATENIATENIATENIDSGQLLNGKITSNNETNQGQNKTSNDTQDTNLEAQNVKIIEIDAPKTDYNSMSVKQLKDIAKSHGLKTTGTKQELIQLLLVHDSK